MRTNYVNSIVEAYQNKTLRGTGKAQNTTVGNLNFAQYLQNKLVADTVKVAEYTGYLDDGKSLYSGELCENKCIEAICFKNWHAC